MIVRAWRHPFGARLRVHGIWLINFMFDCVCSIGGEAGWAGVIRGDADGHTNESGQNHYY